MFYTQFYIMIDKGTDMIFGISYQADYDKLTVRIKNQPFPMNMLHI